MSSTMLRRALALAATLLILASTTAYAAVSTDQADYAPGSIVTISGDNSNDAGYVPGETIHVDVAGPNGYAASCDTTADDSGAWSCQVTLWDTDLAVGDYTFSATGQTSGISEGGTFTDGPPICTALTAPAASPSSTTVGSNIGVSGGALSLPPPGSGCSAGSGLSGHTLRLEVSFNGGAYAQIATPTTDASGNPTGGPWTYVPASAGTYTFRWHLVPGDSGNTGFKEANSPDSNAVTVTAVATNHAPSVAADNASVTVNEGDTATNTGTWGDQDAGDTVALSASVGAVVKNVDGTWSWSYGTTDGPDDSRTVTITAGDGHTTSTATFALVVNNVAPTTTLTTAPSTANEGDTKTYEFSVTDPGADTYLATYTCGTGGSYVASSFSLTGNTGSQTGSFDCFFADGPASPTVSIYFTDSDNAAGTAATQAVTVANVKPTPTIDSLTGNSGVACIAGNTVTLGFSWTDPATTNDTYNYDVNWGDGSTHDTAGFPGATLLYADNSVSGLTHTYFPGGPYQISITVNDSDGGSGSTATSSAFSFLYAATGVLQPVNNTQAGQDPSIFKFGSTIPVKIQVTDCVGTPVPDLANVKITVNKQTSSTPTYGTDESITNTNSPDSGGYMRWSDPIYIYNLATKSLSTDQTATYKITITGPFATVTAYFGTKAK